MSALEKIGAVQRNYAPEARHLYFLFGGIAAGMAMPPFEFFSASKILNENKLFLRDLKQTWYHSGLEGFSKSIEDTVKSIRDEIDLLKPDKVFFVGNSMGGFAAILFATLIGSGHVIAFAPQTFIGPFSRIRAMDFRWQKQIFKTYASSVGKPKYFDLRKVMLNYKRKIKIQIFVSSDHRLDSRHAQHLQGLSGVEIISFKGGGHGIVKDLRDRNLLPEILSGAYLHR